MKSIETIQVGNGLWQDPNTGATNESGFSGLPAGCRNGDGSFYGFGNICFWWSSSEYNMTIASDRSLVFYSGGAYRYDEIKEIGFSVRCLRD